MLWFSRQGRWCAMAQVGASQVTLGSDHPFVWSRWTAILATRTLSDDEKAAILDGNAAQDARIFRAQVSSGDLAARSPAPSQGGNVTARKRALSGASTSGPAGWELLVRGWLERNSTSLDKGSCCLLAA
jgi:hypothetical protein